ncbi:hypothetical protein [Streptomyces sp. NPDC001068]|uniref:hypothetical protein n=1 Tax=Streptomyces sp. NPDC001068 TaxID=3364544 RepID=UPI0036C7072D
MPVERGSLLFTCVDVAGHPEPEGRPVHQAFRRREWRVPAVGPAAGRAGALRAGAFDWRPPQGRVPRPGDRVVMATTRQGLDVLMTAAGQD